MASVIVCLRSGDILSIGATLPEAQEIYQTLLGEHGCEFVEIASPHGALPRIAVRLSDVQSVCLDSTNVEGAFVHSRAVRDVRVAAEPRILDFASPRNLDLPSDPPWLLLLRSLVKKRV